MSSLERSLGHAADAATRLDAASRWLAARGRASPALVLAPSLETGSRVLRRAAGDHAVFGWQRLTLAEWAGRLAARALAARGLQAVGALVREAIAARVVHERAAAGALGAYSRVAAHPGLPRALARTFAALGMAGVSASHPALSADLSALLYAHRAAMRDAGFADRAQVLTAALEAVRDPRSHPLLDAPLLVVDVEPSEARVTALISAALGRAPSAAAFLPSADRVGLRHLEAVLGPPEELPSEARSPMLNRTRRALFRLDASTPSSARDGDATLDDDDAVELFSAPGESRECVEIARRILDAAERGVPFDRMAVLTHSPSRYRAPLREALRRAGIPAYPSRGSRDPDPGGRAFASLLRCRREGLSARAFAEYLSLGFTPASGGSEEPAAEATFIPLDSELAPMRVVADELPLDPDVPTAEAGPSIRAPWRWERLLVESAVIGGLDRWRRRLAALHEKLRADLDEAEAGAEAPPDAIERLARRLEDLAHLQAFALPLLESLDALPATASWSHWIEVLTDLAARALRDPSRVIASLRELEPMGPIEGVSLAEVELVLERRLTEVTRASRGSPAGKVFVSTPEEARGASFEVVFIPGLAEKIFPRKVGEDPIALDALRRKLSPSLEVREDRVDRERRALSLALGAAERRAVLSFPRLDGARGRPRVPSFYALEVVRAAEGRLPTFEDLGRRAEDAGDTRLAWPAPRDPDRAIDGTEYDLAVLGELGELDEAEREGAALYLLEASPSLARALRARFARWSSRRWTSSDGLVSPGDAAREHLAEHAPARRPYSPTGLETYAACPYRFYLRNVARISPREVPEAIESLDARARGSLMAEVQFEWLSAMRDAGELPLTADRFEVASERLEGVLHEAAGRYRERLAPAIDRVFDDAVESLGEDLAQWARSLIGSEWKPEHFELTFGLARRGASDPASVVEPVRLEEGLSLCGAIDLVERKADSLRATDHKSGLAKAPSDLRIGGGEVLQPLLYARALEALFPDAEISGGRLHYCTARGGFSDRVVPLDTEGRAALDLFAQTLGQAFEQGFFPAAPREDACERCDYLEVCGPSEARRVARKSPKALGPLVRLRRQR